MAPVTPLFAPVTHEAPPRTPFPRTRRPMPPVRLQSLEDAERPPATRRWSATMGASLSIHAVLIAAAIVIPLLSQEALPAPGETLRAFFVTPPDVAPPAPPPPPPPAAGTRAPQQAPPVARPLEPATFTAPIDVPQEIAPEEGIDLGVEGGVPGGVEGGVPGGVVGGIVGGLPQEAPAPRVVRIGGKIVAPKLAHYVPPEFPELARVSRLSGIVILEAHVDVNGYIKDVRVLKGRPLLDEPAMAAVRQWRYQPLLLNGQPMEFLLTVVVTFAFQDSQ